MKINQSKLDLVLARQCKTLSEFRGDGLSSQTLKRIKKGCEVQPITMGKLAKALGVDPAEIIEMED